MQSGLGYWVNATCGSRGKGTGRSRTRSTPELPWILLVETAGIIVVSLNAPRSYSLLVLSIQRIRERMPLIVFILLLVLLLMMIGIACACATEHPMKSVDRTLSATSAMPALIEVWTYTFAAILLAAFVLPQRRRAQDRASPQELQRFLF
jgi:hypothetical protein